MNLPPDACPIAYVCIREFCDNLDGTQSLIYDNWDDDWEELKSEACCRKLRPETIRYRAFFAVELIYTELIPMQFFAASLPDLQVEMQNLRVPRTPDGMQELKAKAEKLRKRCGARAVTAKMKGCSTDIQMFFQMSKPSESFEKLTDTCDVLARCLRRGNVNGMTKVGADLAWCMHQAFMPLLDAEQMVRSLLSVTSDNPIHPWQRKT
jgi:hypothetical protein